MTQDDTAPADRRERDGAPVTGDITTGGPDVSPAGAPIGAGEPVAPGPTVSPEQDDPDREGEDRFDAG